MACNMKYVCNLSPELQEQARKELHEDPERREKDIEHIRQWLKKQPHITARTDDWTILRFLRGCKFSLDKTKKKLDMFYTCRGMVPEWFMKRDPLDPKMKEILELGLVMPLPQGTLTLRGRTLIIARLGIRDSSRTTMDDMVRSMLLAIDMVGQDEITSIRGTEVILDFSGFSLQHAAQVTPTIAKKASVIMQEGYPMRPKGLHYINTPPTFDAVFSIFKSFMKEKMKKRVQIHGHDLESLQKAVSKDVLPKEYGGNNLSVEEIKNEWLQKVMDRRDWLLEDEKYKVDEKKRPGKPKTTGDLFGIEGSFRQLNVD